MSSSSAVALFLDCYRKLKEWSDNDPAELDRDIRTDKSLRDLCNEVWIAAYPLGQAERQRRRGFAAPVNRPGSPMSSPALPTIPSTGLMTFCLGAGQRANIFRLLLDHGRDQLRLHHRMRSKDAWRR